MEILKIVSNIISYILIVYIQYKIFSKVFKKAKDRTAVIMLLIFIGILLGGSTIIALYINTKKLKNKRTEIFNQVSQNPSNENVAVLLDYVNEYGLENVPQQWNRLRGVWFAINESPNVSTQIKKQLRDFLTTKGLRLVGNEMNIIDNYSK